MTGIGPFGVMQQNPMVWAGLIQAYLLMTIIAVLLHLSDCFPSEYRLPTENLGKNQWRHNRGIGLDDEFRCIDTQFAPGDFLIGHGPGVRSEAGC